MSASAPLIVGLGGSTRVGSSSERLLRACLAHAERHGARSEVLGGAALRLPPYDPERAERVPEAGVVVEALRRADGVVIASPGYHGGVSGLLKNALDYAEDLRYDTRPYLDGRAVGCISSAAGWQAAGSTLQELRVIVHALRGWPTPIGVAVNAELPVWDADGTLADGTLDMQLGIVASQVVAFARRWRTVDGAAPGAPAAGSTAYGPAARSAVPGSGG